MVERLGEGLAAVKRLAVEVRPASKEKGSVVAYGELELVLRSAIGGGAQGGAAGVLKRLGKATGEANLRGAGSSSASGFKKKKRGLWPLGALSPQRKAVRG